MAALKSIALAAPPTACATFPFSVPAVRALGTLEFATPVTFFIGENGSGKSTVLEGIAAAAQLPTVGSAPIARDETMAVARTLGKALRLSWEGRRTRRGFFLRAEDFFGFTKRLARERAELEQELAGLPVQYEGRSARALELARGPIADSLAGVTRYGDLDAKSHGQSFITLFQDRFVPDGLHLLDEPEAPLSPHSQLGLLLMLQEMVTRGAQFIIATHSPILMAFPGATIFLFGEGPVRAIPYEETEHVTVTRAFLNDPGRYLRQLALPEG